MVTADSASNGLKPTPQPTTHHIQHPPSQKVTHPPTLNPYYFTKEAKGSADNSNGDFPSLLCRHPIILTLFPTLNNPSSSLLSSTIAVVSSLSLSGSPHCASRCESLVCVYVLPPHPSAPPRSWGSKSSLQRCSVKGDAMRGQTDRWTDGRAREEGSAGQGEA